MRRPDSRTRAAMVIVAGLTAILLVICSAVWLVQWSLLKADLQALRSQNQPTNAKELGQFYRLPEGEQDSTELWLKAIQAAAAVGVLESKTPLPIIGDAEIPMPPTDDHWTDYAASKSFLSEQEPTLTAIHRAAAQQGGIRFPFDPAKGIDTIQPDVIGQRTIAKLLTLQACVKVHEGETALALESLLDNLQFVRALQVEPTNIALLLRAANFSSCCETAELLLPCANWTEEQLVSLQAKVRSLHFQQAAQIAFAGERAYMLDGINQLPFKVANVWETRKLLRVSEEYRRALSRPSWQEVMQDLANSRTEFRPQEEILFFCSEECNASYLLTMLAGVIDASAQAETKQRCLQTLIRCQRFQIQRGRYPTSLAEVVAEFPKEHAQYPNDFIDLYNSLPLRLLADDQAVTIYSVGNNQIDNGGGIEPQEISERLDIGLRMLKPTSQNSQTKNISTPAQTRPGETQ